MTHLDKGSLDINDVTNFRLVTVLNCFSKIFENVMKGQLISFIEHYLSVFLSAYRSSYSSQHVLIFDKNSTVIILLVQYYGPFKGL